MRMSIRLESWGGFAKTDSCCFLMCAFLCCIHQAPLGMEQSLSRVCVAWNRA